MKPANDIDKAMRELDRQEMCFVTLLVAYHVGLMSWMVEGP